jgi:hypothetical protein
MVRQAGIMLFPVGTALPLVPLVATADSALAPRVP